MKEENENESKTERLPYIQSVARAVSILNCIAERKEISLTEISEITGLHKSTAFGLVSTLQHFRFVAQSEETGKYRLGLALFQLGSKVNNNLRSEVSPYLSKLVAYTSETVNFMIPEGSDVVYIEKKESPHSMRITTSLGQREPMYRTAGGKAMLSCYSQETVDALLENTDFEVLTKKTLKSAEAVKEELARVRARGYAVDDEELEEGLFCVAAPILGIDHLPVGAISISGPVMRMTPEKQKEYAAELIRCCRELSQNRIYL